MKIQTGHPARGDNFFSREQLTKNAWDLIESGHHILIAAPRRVGKTSLVYHLKDKPKEGFSLMYLITQSVDDENEFFRRILNKVLKTGHIQRSQKILTFLEKHKPSIKKIGPDGVEFGVSENFDYKEILIRILKSIHSEAEKLVIMIDEFPETLENIINDARESPAKHFLQSNRELRQDVEISENVQFVYTGSIGLENIVSRLNAVSTINDLARLTIPPLRKDEARQMIHLLLKNVDFNLSESVEDHILKKIEWLIPFYIQLVIQELKYICRDENQSSITDATVDKAFSGMLEQRQHFEHWHTRLRISFKGKEYHFVKEILSIISEDEQIHSNEIFNLAVKYGLEDYYRDLLGSLVYDGYINIHDAHKAYRYNSPVLRIWWRQNVAN